MSEQSLQIYSGGVPLPKHSFRWESTGTERIRPLLAKLSLACRTGQADDLDRKAQAALYIENLSDLPIKFLTEAVAEWIKTQTFWPSVAELRALAIQKRAAEEWRLRTEREAKDRADVARRDAEMQRPTPEQMADLRERIAALGKRTSSR